jgi:FkbM family methyltransferase
MQGPTLVEDAAGGHTVSRLGQRPRSRQWRARRKALETRLLERLFDFVIARRRLRRIAMRRLFASNIQEGVLCYVPFSDHAVFVDPRDDKIALQLMGGRPWQRRKLETAVAVLRGAGALRENGFFLDVGANIGTQTIYALATNAFAGALAIEADRHNFGILRRNIEINGLSRRVRLIQGAASARRGEALFTLDRQNFGGHSLEVGMVVSPAEQRPVQTYALDDILGQAGLRPSQVGLVKLDVEGHELQVLRGMSALRAARVPLMIEFTGRLLGPGRAEQLKSWLAPVYQNGVRFDGDLSPCRLEELVLEEGQHDLLIWSAP